MPDFKSIPQKIPQQATSPVVIKSAPIAEVVRAFKILSLPNLPTRKNDYEGKIHSFTADTPVATSALKTPVMQDITFKSVTYTDFSGQKRTTNDLVFQNILLTVNQAKKIIRTEIQGRDGTVKEYIGLDDYDIKVNGIIVGDNGHHPADEIIALKNMLIASVAIPVVCTYLHNLGIFNVVVQDFALDQEAGGYSKQNFTIDCLSDQDILLEIL